MMTEAALKGLAYQAINLLKKRIRDAPDGKDTPIDPVLGVVWSPTDPMYQMKRIEREFGWAFGNSDTRGLFFAIIRTVTEIGKPSAVVFASMADNLLPTPKGAELSHEEYGRMVREEYDRLKQEGYIVPVEVLSAWAQSPEHVGILSELTGAGKIALHTTVDRGYREQHRGQFGQFYALPQAQFYGRSKMYGEPYDWPIHEDGRSLKEVAGECLAGKFAREVFQER